MIGMIHPAPRRDIQGGESIKHSLAGLHASIRVVSTVHDLDSAGSNALESIDPLRMVVD